MAKDNAYKNMSTDELTKELAAMQRELQETRFAHAVSPIPSTHVIKEMRRNIARYKTEIHARAQEAQEKAGTAPQRDRIRARRAARRKEVARQRRKDALSRRK
jgi:ribosomal protein L29